MYKTITSGENFNVSVIIIDDDFGTVTGGVFAQIFEYNIINFAKLIMLYGSIKHSSFHILKTVLVLT